MNASLTKIIIATSHGIFPLINSDIITVKTISLSASGSNKLPNSVVKLYFLAIYPSATSVNPASKKMIKEYVS